MNRLNIDWYFNWRNFHFVKNHFLSYKMLGKTGADYVICAHASTGNMHDFDYLTNILSSKYQCISFDMVGRGSSDRLSRYNYYTYVKDSKILIDKLCGNNKVHWIGTSLGGIIGMALAAYFPNKIASLVLNDIGAEIPCKSVDKIRKYISLDPHFDTFDEVLDYCHMAYSKFGIKTKEHWQHIASSYFALDKHGKYRLRYDPRIKKDMKRQNKGKSALSLWHLWNKIQCPVFVIKGEKSNILTGDIIDKMRKTETITDEHIISDCGHAPALFYEQDIAVIERWIGQV